MTQTTSKKQSSGRNLKPVQPGQNPADTKEDSIQEGEQNPEVEDVVEGFDQRQHDADEDMVEISQSELQEMLDKAASSGVKKYRRDKELGLGKSTTMLPSQEDVDAKKIKRAVLTSDGYVVPEVHASDKAAIERRQGNLNS